MNRVLATIVALVAVSIPTGAAGAQSGAEISLVHGLPGTSVDVVVDGQVVVSGVAPGTVTDVSDLAGSSPGEVTIVEAGSSTVVVGPVAGLEIPASGSHSLVAHLSPGGEAQLTLFENGQTPPAAGSAGLTLRHAADAPAVDVVSDDAVLFENVAHGSSADLGALVEAFAGEAIAPTAGLPIAQIPALVLAADTETVLYVVGSLELDTVTVVVHVVDIDQADATDATDAADADADESASTSAPVPTAVNTGSPLDLAPDRALVLIGALSLLAALVALTLRSRLAV